jgi:hypothetical protein
MDRQLHLCKHTKFDTIAYSLLLAAVQKYVRNHFRQMWILQYRLKPTCNCYVFLPCSDHIRNYYQLWLLTYMKTEQCSLVAVRMS